MKIFIASDHAGFELKQFLIEKLSAPTGESGVPENQIVDCGAYKYVSDDDYPLYIDKAAAFVSAAEEAGATTAAVRGIVIGGSGQGEAIAANRFAHVRAAEYYGGEKEHSHEILKLSREHNDSNVLSLGARFLSKEEALEVVEIWLKTGFSNDPRHARRIAEIEDAMK